MKILWVSNILIGKLPKALNRTGTTSGNWIEALLEDFINADEHELIIITTEKRKDIYFLKEKNLKYYLLPCGNVFKYDHNSFKYSKIIQGVIDKEKPDIVTIWGTESSLGLAVLNCLKEIPSVIYIQGILETIARYYEAGMSKNELLKAISVRDIIKFDWIMAQKRNFFRRAINEKEMINLSKNIISENLWCYSHCKAIYEKCITHYCQLSIRNVFNQHHWSLENTEKFTIMCNASGYPLKGLHVLLKALSLVIKIFPKAKLYVPGQPMGSERGIIQKIKRSGYSKYIGNLIKQLDIENNVIFLGNLSAEQMAEKMSHLNVFVMPSAIENHSSTLKEAMLVGVPCISSYVGGIPEYINHNENGLLYRFEEYEMLAQYICGIFNDDELAFKLSTNGKLSILKNRNTNNIYKTIIKIYKDIITTNELVKECIIS